VKPKYLAVLAVTGAVLLCASSAMARRSFPTTINYDDSAPVGTGGTFVSSGHLSSPRIQCRALRVVKLIGHYPSGRTELLDIDFTSFNGAWATKADLTGTDHLTARVTKYKFGRKGHRKVCQPDSVGFPSPAAP
jgi:hypothetical protein